MKIVLAVDGSDQSYEAIRAVESLAPVEQLIVLHAMNIPGLSYPTLGPNLDKELALTVVQVMNEEADHLLDRVISLLPSHHDSIIKRLEEGNPAEKILSVAEECSADLIVIGARGLNKFSEHVFGSVSHRVMTHAPCSTLIVKSPMRHVQQVLLPVENEKDASVIAEFLSKTPYRESPALTILHVIPFSEPVWPVGALIPESFRKEMMDHAEGMTKEIASRLNGLGYKAEGKAVVGVPSSAIVQELASKKYDLILMRSKNRTGMSRFLLGSVSHSVTHHSPCSVLFVH